MDDGEVEISNHGLLPNSDFHESTPVETLLDEFLNNTRTCTHTHTCNPPGPDAAHTHTCYHTHTRVITSKDDDDDDDGPSEKQPSVSTSRKPLGNREAVRRYREKKKAHTAYLEEEVKKLRLLNQKLLRKLQGQALLEAEVIRLRTLLLDMRGKIDVELGVFPYQRQSASTSSHFKEGDCSLQSVDPGANLQCGPEVPCLHPQLGLSSSLAGIGGNVKVFNWEGSCEPPGIVGCRHIPNGGIGLDVSNGDVHLDCMMPTSMDDCMMPTSMDMMGSLVSSASPDE